MGTELIKNKVIAKAVGATLPDDLFFAKMAGVVVPNFDLKGAGKGDTVQFSNFDLSDLTLQTLVKGSEIEVNELTQSSIQVTIEQLAHGKRFYDQDVQYSLSGESLDAEATKQLRMAFADGVDNLSLAALVTKSAKADMTAGLNVKNILDQAVTKWGEKTFNGDIVSLTIHPTQFPALNNDPDFERISNYGYENATFGRAEIGRLYGVIPVVMSNKVTFDATASKYNNILVPKASVLTVIGKDVNVERERMTKLRATDITGDIFIGIHAEKEGLVFQA